MVQYKVYLTLLLGLRLIFNRCCWKKRVWNRTLDTCCDVSISCLYKHNKHCGAYIFEESDEELIWGRAGPYERWSQSLCSYKLLSRTVTVWHPLLVGASTGTHSFNFCFSDLFDRGFSTVKHEMKWQMWGAFAQNCKLHIFVAGVHQGTSLGPLKHLRRFRCRICWYLCVGSSVLDTVFMLSVTAALL